MVQESDDAPYDFASLCANTNSGRTSQAGFRNTDVIGSTLSILASCRTEFSASQNTLLKTPVSSPFSSRIERPFRFLISVIVRLLVSR